MPYIPPKVLEQARQIDLLTYLQNCEPHELVRISGNNYTTRTHDSLKISNGKWIADSDNDTVHLFECAIKP